LTCLLIYDIVYLSNIAPKKSIEEEAMKKELFCPVVAWVILVMVILGGTAFGWVAQRQNHLDQTRWQAVYLAELSGYLSPRYDWPTLLSPALVAETRLAATLTTTLVGQSQEPEKELSKDLILFSGTNPEDGSSNSRLFQLMWKYPGAIKQALKGKPDSAIELEQRWAETRFIPFFPFGVTLLLEFLFIGLLCFACATLIAQDERGGSADGDGGIDT